MSSAAAPASASAEKAPDVALGVETPPAEADPEMGARITALARAELGDMHAEGPVLAGRLQEGESLERTFEMRPGGCYGAVATGEGVAEIELQFVAVVATDMPPAIVAADTSTGTDAVVGGSGSCVRNPMPIPSSLTLVVRATTGSGRVAARIFAE